MIIIINEGQVHLLPAEIRFIVKTGTVWLTREGTGKDEIYRAGDVIPAACSHGKTLVQALSAHAALVPHDSRGLLCSGTRSAPAHCA